MPFHCLPTSPWHLPTSTARGKVTKEFFSSRGFPTSSDSGSQQQSIKLSVPSFSKLSLVLDFRTLHWASYTVGHSHSPGSVLGLLLSSLCSVPKLFTQSMAIKTICNLFIISVLIISKFRPPVSKSQSSISTAHVTFPYIFKFNMSKRELLIFFLYSKLVSLLVFPIQ